MERYDPTDERHEEIEFNLFGDVGSADIEARAERARTLLEKLRKGEPVDRSYLHGNS